MPKGLRVFLQHAPVFALSSFVAAGFWQEPMIVVLLLSLISLGLLLWHRSKHDTVAFFLGFFLGPLAELLPVLRGAWDYGEAETLPLWLPLAWGISSVILKNVGEGLAPSPVSKQDEL